MSRHPIGLISSTPQALFSDTWSRRLALGFLAGMVIGLIPRESLIPWALALFTLLTTAHIGCAALTALVFAILGPMLDPLTHRLGGLILTANGLEPAWSSLSDLPLVAWTRFNNTVVMGNLVLSGLLALPVYLAAHRFFEMHGPGLHRRLSTRAVYRWLVAPAPQASGEEVA